MLSQAGWPVRSQEGWDWAFEHNPDRKALEHRLGQAVASGWVLENDEGIQGYLGNLPQSFSLGGSTLFGATCTSLFVSESCRAHSVKLMRTFFTQPGAQMVYTTTANANSAPLYQLYKAQAVADPRVMQTLLWVASDKALLEHALERKGLSALRSGAIVLAPAFRQLRQWTQRATPPRNQFAGQVRRLTAADIGVAFDELWQSLRGQPGLWLNRDRNMVRWRCGDPDKLEDIVLFAAFQNEALLGYVIAAADRVAHGCLPRAFVLDFVTAPGASEHVAPALVGRLCEWAAAEHLPWVEAPRFGGMLGAQLAACRPHVRQLQTITHHMRVLDKTLPAQTLHDPAWPCSGMDGDAWFGHTDRVVKSARVAWTEPSAVCASETP